MNNINTKTIRHFKSSQESRSLKMLTCYDFPMAQMLQETSVDLILVGDSVGNVVLGYDSTIPVTLDEMILFTKAVRRGAPQKYLIADMPFGSYNTIQQGINSASRLFKETNAQAVKLEGAFPYQLKLIERLTQIGIPVMGHIGLKPQSVNVAGGYYSYGKNQEEEKSLILEAKKLQDAGVFSLVLECVEASVAKKITDQLSIPTIGIGSGNATDGQVLVLHDLLKIGKHKVPKFCTPLENIYERSLNAINEYLK
jgi:3-methyl-2-oxobutanoate hydroxymethyltransferase